MMVILMTWPVVVMLVVRMLGVVTVVVTVVCWEWGSGC